MSDLYQTEFERKHGLNAIADTLGGADVTQVFVHDVMSIRNSEAIASVVQGYKRYDERALVVARAHDIVCVLEKVDSDYLALLSSLGIGPREGNVIVASESDYSKAAATLLQSLMESPKILSRIGSRIGRNHGVVLYPFMVTEKEVRLRTLLEAALKKGVSLQGGGTEIVDYAYSKHHTKARAIDLGIPVAEGAAVPLQMGGDGKPLDLTPIEDAICQYLEKTGRVIVRGCYGASGSSTVIVENSPGSVQEALGKIGEKTDNSIYLVEVMLDVSVSVNILMHIQPDSGEILCVSVTDQRLDENLVHEGNVYPPTAKKLKGMMDSSRKISAWLQAEGYSGLVGFDFGEYVNEKTGQEEYFMAEINPRVNAALYPKALMEHLNLKQKEQGRPRSEAFLSAHVVTAAGSFAELREMYGHLFFDPLSGKGVVPYNLGCLEYGKFSVAVFGKDREEVAGMYAILTKPMHPEGQA